MNEYELKTAVKIIIHTQVEALKCWGDNSDVVCKTFTENLYSKRHILDLSWRYGLKNIFLGITLFVFQDEKMKLSASV